MKVAVFSAEPYDRQFLEAASDGHEFIFFATRLEPRTASLAVGFPAVCIFVNDDAGEETVRLLAEQGTQLILLRCSGYNNVAIETANQLEIKVARVAAYSPHSVAEHAVGLMLMLNRKLYRAYNRVREDNFSLNGLLGFDLYGCTIGIVGTGKIGIALARILHGFGCNLLGYDRYPNPQFEAVGEARYVELPELYARADIISLHCPLTPETYHLINAEAIAQMKPDVMLINTSRGQLIDTQAAIAGIKSERIGYLGIDVYENEENLFFRDLSDKVLQDDTFNILHSFPNVVITAHQAFFTRNALEYIAKVTLANLTNFEQGNPLQDEVLPQ